ncbi:aminotransferase class IV [Brevibacterium linens]|uniref:Branched-chain amino acid aminotransferase/4-amino-4-deoxychorismate lyase n=1 Tax=Brevibacterium linens TaxID=1703 RepID=A0A2H1J7C1_BRELN|nr:aminotransferase class IV [Brevibacterium linens]SMX83370.1 Branched-chain amino acid aminotransferase/4-amino-4-deoxychorismate lyase [Brevibacterium linens]
MSVWLWNQQDRRFEPPTADLNSWTLTAADSWFVEDGRVRAFDRHRARFGDAASQVGMGNAITDDFWAAVVEQIPATGEWFPRVDVLEPTVGVEPVLALRLRPAPERTRELRVRVPSYPDPRTIPGRKGPDIGLLGRLVAQARADHDCSEVVLLSDEGIVIEGATTSLLWWDDEALCAPAPELGALPGVTSAMILDEARSRSIPVEFRRVLPEELVGHDVWLVNALHGIRRVREFVDAPSGTRDVSPLGEESERFIQWRLRLESARRPLRS